MFPVDRPRRLRRSESLRRLTRETRLHADHLVYPLFACAGDGVRREIPSMPGNFHLSVDRLVEEASAAWDDAANGRAAKASA